MKKPNLPAEMILKEGTTHNITPGCGGPGAKLPAGLTDQKAEIFSDGEFLKGTFNGEVKSFAQMPSLVKLYFGMLYTKANEDNPACQLTLLKVFKPCNYSEELQQFVKCNYGGFDNNPDFFPEKNPKKEYWNCGQRGNCEAEGIVCRPNCIHDNNLQPREVDVIKFIAEGLTSGEVAAKLCLSESTIHTHERNIKSKLGIHTRGEIIKFAYKNNILL